MSNAPSVDYSAVIAEVDRDKGLFESQVSLTSKRNGYTWKHQQIRREKLIRKAIESRGLGKLSEEEYLLLCKELMLQAGAVKNVPKFESFTVDIIVFKNSDWKQGYQWYQQNC